MDIDTFLPKYDSYEKHQLETSKTPKEAYDTFQTIDFTESWMLKGLFLLRGIRSSDQLRKMFIPLIEKPPEVIVQGMIGRPWTLSGHLLRIDSSQFFSFNEPNYAKIAWQIKFTKTQKGCLIETETRIQCTDVSSRRKFGWYWFFIRPFSSLVRFIMLRMIGRRAK